VPGVTGHCLAARSRHGPW